MHRQTACAVLGIVAVLAATPKTPAFADGERWSGFYGGFHLGYGGGRDDVAEVNGPRSYFPDTSGGVAGVQLGWQHQLDRMVAGIEIEGGHLGQSGSLHRSDGGSEVTADAKLGLYGTLSARVGYLMTPSWLLYTRAGITFAEMNAETVQACPATACSVTPSRARTRDHAWGGTLGIGAEYALTEKWTARAEYQYAVLRTELALPDGGSGPGWNHDADLHQVKIAISRRF